MTRQGQRAAHDLATGSWVSYAELLLHARWLKPQLARVLPLMERTPSGLRVDVAKARRVGPQLSTILGWLSTGEGHRRFAALPNDLLAALTLREDAQALPAWVQKNAAVGRRAELYSLLLERSRNKPVQILHVALDSDRYGYDIEDRSRSQTRMIEVKGSTGRAVQFFLSRNERAVAAREGRNYVLHFWGGIDMATDMRAEYPRLRAAGYPLVYNDLETHLTQDYASVIPTQWLVKLVAE